MGTLLARATLSEEPIILVESKERFIGGRKGGVPLITVFA